MRSAPKKFFTCLRKMRNAGKNFFRGIPKIKHPVPRCGNCFRDICNFSTLFSLFFSKSLCAFFKFAVHRFQSCFMKLQLVSAALFLTTLTAPAQSAYQFTTSVNPANITIVRDSFGVPHIYGKTDAETAYGLAWANAEDGFATMQETLLSGKGMMGRVKGKEGAAIDFFVHAIGARDIVNERFSRDLTPEFVRYLEGYCQGVNAYAKQHPKEVLVKKAFPVTPKDILQGYVLSFSALTGVAGDVGDVVKGKFDSGWTKMFGNDDTLKNSLSMKRKARKNNSSTSIESAPYFPYASTGMGMGSNAFAMNKNITADGNTYLCINPHMLVEGPLSFYEAHLCSEEGLNITGAIFQGGTSVFMGNNEDLGWTHTFNYFDGVDVYALKMHPEKKLEYEFDGSYYKLEKRPVWLKVKIGKHLKLPVKKTTYWSAQHGPVFKSKGGKFFAVRNMSFMTIKAAQQFYYMDKARSFAQFKDALHMQGLGMFNVVYADKEGNIYYLSNGLIPDRKAAYDWSGLIPGDDSKYVWTKAIPVDSLPNNLNPECGYVFNTNNTPFNATCSFDNDDRKRLPCYVDGRPGENNRSTRFMELVNEKSAFTFEDFKRIKFDNRYPKTSPFLQSVKGMFELNPAEYPDIADVLGIINTWDKVADTGSIGATVFGLTLEPLFKGKDDEEFVTGLSKTKEDFVNALRFAKAHLLKNFGTVQVPLSKLQKFVRGEKDYAIPGFPDMLMANYPRKPYKNGSYKLEYGDTYIQFVKFTPQGAERIESLLPYNTLPTASDYKDQTLLYQKKLTKTSSLNKEEILKNAVKIYQPK